MDIPDDKIVQIIDAAFFQGVGDLVARVTPEMRFAHYTSAETAMRIIRGDGTDRALWLRNATEMNDFLEIEYGQRCLETALRTPGLDDRLTNIGTELKLNIAADVFGAMGSERLRIKAETFLLSLSEHDANDTGGLLSMWRAYGGSSNVCLLLKTGPFITPQTAYDVDITPVDYRGPDGFTQRFMKIVDDVEFNLEGLKQLDPALIALNWKIVLDDLVLSTKHPGFIEEKEWRLIHRYNRFASSPAPPSKVVCVNGIVQTVLYLPMRDIPEHSITNATLPDILERIIIGPTPNPEIVKEAFIRLLREANVANASELVATSDVPLRR
jgi:hypothetical protein